MRFKNAGQAGDFWRWNWSVVTGLLGGCRSIWNSVERAEEAHSSADHTVPDASVGLAGKQAAE